MGNLYKGRTLRELAEGGREFTPGRATSIVFRVKWMCVEVLGAWGCGSACEGALIYVVGSLRESVKI